MRIAITRANAGIGFAAATMLADRGNQVVAMCRSPERAEAAFGVLEPAARSRILVVQLDLAAPDSVRAAADAVSTAPLDALINNAATFEQGVTAELTPSGHERVWATNHLGPWELTAHLSAALAEASDPHVVFVASKGIVTMPRIRIRFDELDGLNWSTPARAYYHAKLGQIMTAMTLADHAGGSVGVSCLRVPAVRIGADRLATQPALLRALYAPKNALAAEPRRIAEVYTALLERARTTDPSDIYVDERMRVVPVPASAHDEAARDRLWAASSEATGHPSWAWPVPAATH